MHDEYRSKECVGVEFYKAEKAETNDEEDTGWHSKGILNGATTITA